MVPNLLLIITGLVGLLTTALIFSNYRSNRLMNFYIILLILILSCRFFLSGLTYFVFDSSFKTIYYKYSNVSLVIIPICYLYFKDLFRKNHQFQKNDLLHFIFPLFLFVYLVKQKKFYFVFSAYVPLISFLIFSFFYVFLSFKLLKKHLWLKKRQLKVKEKHHKLIKNWTLFLFTALVICCCRLILSLYLELYYQENLKGHSYQWISAIIWLVILFKILNTPEVLFGYNVLQKKLSHNESTSLILRDIWFLTPEKNIKNSQHLILKEKIDPNLIDYIKKIEKSSFNHEMFRDSKITISDLANKLNIPKSHLSYLFKYHSKISFTEYKKFIRILDAINQIESNYLKNNTLESLSKKVGFTSYNPFFTSFKDFSGQSPLEYYKVIKADIS